MHSLYQALLLQHGRQLTPMRCAEQTIAQLHRYFEDVVLENNLSALVIESLPFIEERPLRDVMRVREVGRIAHRAFFFVSAEDSLNRLQLRATEQDREPIFLKQGSNEPILERFVVIADARFSALLASVKDENAEDISSIGDEVIWTFEPDIVYSALEYLMARVTAEKPIQAATFSAAVRTSMPKATSLQLTVSVTTKLARLLQEQTGREIAVNRIASAIRNTLDVEEILQITVNEVGRALDAQHCAISIEGGNDSPPTTKIYFRGEDTDITTEELTADVEAYFNKFSSHAQPHVLDGRTSHEGQASQIHPLAVVPLLYQSRLMGALLVRSNNVSRVWQENEVLLLQTVADQVAVAVSLARLFDHTQKQALTDVLTGCFNRRSFEMQLERELKTAKREQQNLSLVMLDVDYFKNINDAFGHDKGDNTLRAIGECLSQEVRGRDTAARYGGEEFILILPGTNEKRGVLAAERLRTKISELYIEGVGNITASFGVSTYPSNGETRDQLVSAADVALYEAKRQGRNRVFSYEDLANLPPERNDLTKPKSAIPVTELPETAAPFVEIIVEQEKPVEFMLEETPTLSLPQTNKDVPEILHNPKNKNEQNTKTRN